MFKINELVDIVDPVDNSHMVEGVITGLVDQDGFYYLDIEGQKSKFRSDGTWAIHQRYLRKKKPPLSSWDNEVFSIIKWYPTKGAEA